jgi:uracil phosphoribosyltransferase
MGGVDITVIDHPLAAERLTILREASTPNAEFRAALDGLAGMLVYEATRLLPSQEVQVTTPLGPAYGRRLSTVPMLVPILRAGVGLVNGALRLLPSAEVGFVGLARDEETFLPFPYLAKLPDRLEDRPCFVLDPMLATGGSLEYTCRLLVERGAPQPITVVCVLAAPEGLTGKGEGGGEWEGGLPRVTKPAQIGPVSPSAVTFRDLCGESDTSGRK